MRCMIMAAGLGTRLRPLTDQIPKPMVPILNRPALYHILRLLAQHEITEVVVNLHYFPDLVTGYLGDGSNLGIDLRYSFEEELLGTAGGVKNNQEFLGDDTFLVLSGDAVTDVDLTGLLAAHRAHGGISTLAVKEVEDPSEYGVVVLGEEHRVQGFQEKPAVEEALSLLCNTGMYVFEPAIFDRIPAGEFYDFGRMVFHELLRDQVPFYVHAIDAYWNDVGGVAAYRQACFDALTGAVAVERPGEEVSPGVWVGPGARLAPGAELRAPVLVGPGCTVEAGVVLEGPVTLGEGCVIGRGASLARSILWNGVQVGADASVTDCVIAGESRVAEGARVDGEIAGPGTSVGG